MYAALRRRRKQAETEAEGLDAVMVESVVRLAFSATLSDPGLARDYLDVLGAAERDDLEAATAAFIAACRALLTRGVRAD